VLRVILVFPFENQRPRCYSLDLYLFDNGVDCPSMPELSKGFPGDYQPLRKTLCHFDPWRTPLVHRLQELDPRHSEQ
jgi:hypothetical protein